MNTSRCESQKKQKSGLWCYNALMLQDIAKKLLFPGKGILAADESVGTADKRFEKLGIPKTAEMRRKWRELLLSTPGIERGLSGVILFDETLRQNTERGVPMAKVLKDKGIVVGIKVDKGTVPLSNFPDEKITEGLDGLSLRLSEYVSLGAEFTKWRSVILIGKNIPTDECIEANAFLLAQYAARSEEAGMVPIIEPEVLLDGDHTIEESRETIKRTLKIVFETLKKYRVDLSGLILKSSMALPGKDSGRKATAEEVAKETIFALKDSVPPEVPGVVFLSGGQTSEEATANLNAMAKIGPHPWRLTFSYSRALQDPVMKAWMGSDANALNAQDIFLKRVEETALASLGKL